MSAEIDSALILLDHSTRLPDDTLRELGLAGFDDTHQEFFQMLQFLARVEDPGLYRDVYHELHRHSEQHFQHEFRLMLACGFPALVEHHAEHLRILNEMVFYRMRLQQGRMKEVREFVSVGLHNWFTHHVSGPDRLMSSHPRYGLVTEGRW